MRTGAPRLSAIPMRTRFRGIEVARGRAAARRGRLGRVRAVLGLRRRRVRAVAGAPRSRRPTSGGRRRVARSVPVNATVPGGGPGAGAASGAARRGCRTAKVKVAEPGQTEADDLARVEAVRDALGPGRAGAGRRQRRAGTSTPRCGWCGCSTGPPAGWSTSSSRAAPSRSWPRYAGGSTCRSPPTSRSAGPTTRCGWPGWRRPTSRCSRCSRSAGCAACLHDRGADRSAGGGLVGAGDLGRHRGRAGAGGRAARAALRLRAGHPAAAGRRRDLDAVDRRRRRAPRRTSRAGAVQPADQETERRWRDRLQAVRAGHGW